MELSYFSNPNIPAITAKGGGGGGNDYDDTVGGGSAVGSGGGSWGGGGSPAPGSAEQPGTNSLYGAVNYGYAEWFNPGPVEALHIVLAAVVVLGCKTPVCMVLVIYQSVDARWCYSGFRMR